MKPVLPIMRDYETALAVMSAKLMAVRYSKSTHDVYNMMFREFLKHIYPKPHQQITKWDILQFQTYLVRENSVGIHYV